MAVQKGPVILTKFHDFHVCRKFLIGLR